MEIIEAINKLKKMTDFSQCQEGYYTTIEDIYDLLIEPNLPMKDIVLKWHELLLKYAFDKDAVFVLRKYSSNKINGDWATRRGMITQYNNVSYVGIDNYSAHIIFALAHIGFVPDYDDFKSSMINRDMPIRFRRENQIEKLKSAYPSAPYDNVGINDNYWKLSHIVSANQNYPYPVNLVLKQNFPNTSNSDWILDENGAYYFRKLNKAMKSEEIDALRIHFLRVLSPINHFLSPKRTIHQYQSGTDIGEDKDLILYIKKKFKQRYEVFYDQYLLAVKEDFKDNRTIENIGKKVMNLEVNFEIECYRESPINANTFSESSKITKNDNAVAKKSTVSPNISKDQLFHMIALYISNGYSFRELERIILNINSKSRGGGFISKGALNNMGVTTLHKGTIKTKDQLTKASLTFNDTFGDTLKELIIWINTSNCLDQQNIFI